MEIFPTSFNSHTLLATHAVFLFSSTIKYAAAATILGNETNELALLDFKSQIIEDPSRVFASWNQSVHFCQWTRVKCGLTQERSGRYNLRNLSLLNSLDLAENSFHEEIPQQLSRLSRLQNLNLSFNYLTGEIPVNLSHCANLKSLVLDHNTLMGQIPYQVGSLTKLVRLYLRNNNLTGIFPVSIGNLTSSEELYLSYNSLEGEVPASLARLTKLRLLGLSVNSFSGEFPPSLYNLLYLANCQFNGSIPSSLANASKLIQLDFPVNNFTGNIPKGFGNLRNLLWLNVWSNHLGYGKNDDLDFVNSLTNCSCLQMFHFGDNRFVGTLPHSTVNLSSQLQRLLFFGNIIGGSISREISNLVNLNLLDRSNNNLTGRIPDSIVRLTNLGSLNLGNNLLTRVIPSSLGNLTELVYLYLGLNRLEGNIPSTLGNCNQVLRLDISENNLTGSIPQQLIALSSLTKVYAYYNSLTGPLPMHIGTIPDLEDLQDLQSLDLSLNNLSGPIPHFIANLTSLLYLNLSFNNLEGELHLRPCVYQETQKTQKKKHVLSLKLILTIVFAASFSILALLIVFLCWRRNLKDQPEPEVRSESARFYPNISYEELRTATGGFSSENLIGSGSFGTVYKGTFASNGMVVAVKVISACSSSDFKGNELKALVFQFMPKGNLDEWLHPEREIQKSSLTILQRMNIIIDVASALHYLHHQCQTSMIHCDIKPQNILLDEDLTAHLGDYGLMRLVPGFSNGSKLHQFSSLGAMGTIGYAAPGKVYR
ncbi:hypothetical protein R3W88_009246 [Solanum pinnatisectum]|uniref:Protein kinase domain-containing protein n=1 Tax=Solanum pinnatisectum TaxID=50273 RepID=A0AAV9MD56_9SOLN|nr:hypothetical protein R3W88_009246 [Solanum pinnatisectum]